MRFSFGWLLVLSASKTFWAWINGLGGPGLIVLALADNSAIPLPGSMDVLTVLLSAHNRDWWLYYGFMATVGAVIGGYLTYRLAEKGGEEALERKIGKRRAAKVYKQFEKQGGYWVFGGSILPPPFPIVPVLMGAGALAYPKRKFLTALALGRAIRYFLLAWIAHVYGTSIIGWLSEYYKPMLYTLIVLAVLGGLGVLVYFKWYRPRKQKQATGTTVERQNEEAKRRVA